MQGPPALTARVDSRAPAQPVIKETDFLVQVVSFCMTCHINRVLCTGAIVMGLHAKTVSTLILLIFQIVLYL